jgi:hypothetical protein
MSVRHRRPGAPHAHGAARCIAWAAAERKLHPRKPGETGSSLSHVVAHVHFPPPHLALRSLHEADVCVAAMEGHHEAEEGQNRAYEWSERLLRESSEPKPEAVQLSLTA